MTNDYIEHHGILGMKWGVRRYQNKDGSYTSAGRKRYGFWAFSQQQKRNFKEYDKDLKAVEKRYRENKKNAKTKDEKKHYKDIRIKELRRAADRYKQNQIKNYKTNINRDSIARVAVTGGLTGAGLYIVGSALKPGSFGSDFLKNVGPEVAVGSAILSSLLYINHDSIEKYGKVRF